MDTVGHDAPSLSGVLIPMLLYADDLIIMSTTAAGLQRQLDALQQFCHQRQLSVNLAKTKVITFGSKPACQAFICNSNEVERVETYEVRPVDDKIGDAAELLHRQFLKHLLGVRDSTANVIVLAELGRFPLCFHWWQQILRYHNRINDLSDDERLIKCAFVEGMHDPAHLFWSHKVHTWLQGQSVGLGIEDELDVGTVIGSAKIQYAQTWHQNSLSSIARYQPLQQGQP